MRTKEERTRHESRLRRQAERGGAGQCTSHSRPRSLTCIFVCSELNAVASISRNPRAIRLVIPTGIIAFSRYAIVGTSPPPLLPQSSPLDPNTGLAAVIYRTLLRRLGDHCENYGVIIARKGSMDFTIVLIINVNQRISARSWANTLKWV